LRVFKVFVYGVGYFWNKGTIYDSRKGKLIGVKLQ